MNLLLIICAAVVILIGVGLFAYAGYIIAKRRAKALWTQTKGEIIESQVEKFRGNRANVTPQIRYTYKVNLASYESTVISSTPIEGRFVAEVDFQALKEKYAVGKQVTVYYNPDDPAEAVLDTTAYMGDLLIFFIIGGMVLLCGLSILSIYFI